MLDFIKERVTLVIGSSHPEVASKDIATENEECSADGAVDESNTWNERKEPPLVAEVDGTDATVLVNETQFSENDQEKNPASRKSSLEVTINEEILEDDDLFYGFNEPFTAENLNAAKSQRNVTPPRLIETAPLGFPAVGSEEWAKGWARGPDGNFVHVREQSLTILRLYQSSFICSLYKSYEESLTLPKESPIRLVQEAQQRKLEWITPSILLLMGLNLQIHSRG